MYISKHEFNNKYKILKPIFSIFVKKRNKNYIKQKEKQYKDILTNINNCKLDKNQKKIVLSEENSSLVIAGAGSGKSLTILGRVLYLIQNGINPRDILIISFTNLASNNLKKNLLKNHIDTEVITFHKLGRNILKANGYDVTLVEDKILKTIIEEEIHDCDKLCEILPWVKFKGSNDYLLKNELLKNSDEINSLIKLFNTFINLFKANGYTENKFDSFFIKNKFDKEYIKYHNKEFLLLAKKIYIKYQNYLLKNRQIDFHDMISKSIDVVNKNDIYPYKYIIVDEYQDTSLIKCELIKTIKKKTNASLLAVGDDFQSIYRFTGSNLKIFTKFNDYFPNSRIFKIENTYRNSIELLKISNKFILKNSKQIYKRLTSQKHNPYPIYIYYYKKSYVKLVNDLLKQLTKNTIVLGRNNKDLIGIKGKTMTVHKSKGLEADNVIIVNLSDDITGFPNKIVNDDVLKYVLDSEEYPFDEERRLFYVALTRAKQNIYLIVNKNKPSIFVTELLKDFKQYIRIIDD